MEGNSISAAAVDALCEKIDIDFRKVLDTLMADCPYEMYWYDKTVGALPGSWGYGWDPKTQTLFIGEYDYENEKLIAFEDSFLVYEFSVAKDYSTSGVAGTCDFDTSVAEAVQTAAARAKAIVDGNASKGDLAKLTAYKEAICDAVSYNDDAATNNPPYGDPWQLVWVFDDDESTKVVCEGYSKAFQYLCDMSAFRGGTTAVCASGVMYTSKNSTRGNHMWNIVTLGGVRFLVDVTNCDSGTVGYPDLLFMKGYTSREAGSGDETVYGFEGRNGITVYYIAGERTTSLFDPEELDITDVSDKPEDHEALAGDCGDGVTWALRTTPPTRPRRGAPMPGTSPPSPSTRASPASAIMPSAALRT